MFTDIEEALAWVMARHSRGHSPQYFREVLRELGDPQETYPVIHVAGTDGKGSTVTYLADILHACGKKTGTFTSPYLISHLDRIRVSGTWIPEGSFLGYLNGNRQMIEEKDLSMFEIDTLIAFLYFRDEKVDAAVIECGLGGREDTTNVFDETCLSIITTIGFDHMERLGNTLSEIAGHKAGIIRENGRVLIGILPEEAEKTVREEAEKKHAKLYHTAFRDEGERCFSIDGERYRLGTPAEYQKENAALALHAARLLGIDIKADAVKDAVLKSRWEGRFEKVGEEPLIILDGAHNIHGMQALVTSMRQLPRPVVGVFSALKDKQGPEMAEMLLRVCDRLLVTQFAMYRADSAEALAAYGGEVRENWKEAIDEGVSLAGENGSVVIAGSLYFISTVRSEYFGLKE